MKSQDYLTIFSVMIFSLIVSVVVSTKLITTPKNRQQEVEVVTPITDEFTSPSTKYFNDKSIDPTQLIKIGDKSNPKPL